ncbi:Luminal-binding protein 4 [Linum perenne]
MIGMDLGTTYSCVGVHHQGNYVTPSWVSFTDNEILIGEAAKNQTAVNPERTIFDVKRLIGRKFEDEEVQRHMKLVPYKIVSKEGKPYIEKKIKDAVVTVPVYFNDAQRQATKDACAIAGLNVARIIDKPTAAVIAYGIDRKASQRNVLILRIDNGDVEVLSTSADTHFGGEDFDRRITDYLIWLIKNKHGRDIIISKDDIGKLRKEAERAKRALSREQQVCVKIESLLSEPLSRSEFEQLSKNLLRKAMRQVMEAIREAKLEKEQIDEIVMIGGSSRIPKVEQMLEDYFKGKKPINHGIHPDETVVFGASFLAGTLSKDGVSEPMEERWRPLPRVVAFHTRCSCRRE